MAGDPALIVRVTTNLEDLKTGMAESKKSIEASTQAIEQFAGKASSGLAGADKATQGWGASLGTVNGLLGTFGLAVSAAGLVGFVGSVFDAASGINDMSKKLGISAEAVQGFKFAAEQAGASLETVGSAITRMNANLSEGDKGTVAALQKAGLQFETIRAMKPEDAFLAITDAIREIPDPMGRTEVALQLLGKSAAELLPAIQDGFRETADAASKMSDDTIKSLADAQSAWAALGTQATIVTGNMIAAFMKLPEHTKTATAEITSSWTSVAMFVENASKFGVGVAMTMATATAAAKTTKDAVVELPKPIDDAAAAWRRLEAQRKADEEAAKTHAANVKAWTADESKAQELYADLLDRLHREALKHYEAEEAAKQKQTAAVNKTVLDGNAQIMALNADLHDAEMKASLDSTTYQIMKIWEKAEAEIKAFKGTEQQAAIHADLVYTLADQEARAITDVMASATVVTSAALDEMFGKATFVLDGTIRKADEAVARAQTYSMGGGHQMTAAEYDAYYQTPQGIQDIIRNKGKRYYEGEVLPRAGGGPVASGMPYLVGERGPELFVPDRSGAVVASGGGLSSTTLNIYITQPLGTPDAIGEAITARMKSLGMRL